MSAVETKHKAFTAFYSKWYQMRNVFDGTHSMKKNAKLYIQKLKGAEEEDYQNFIGREVFENYTKATAKGMSGLIFAKAPQIELPPKLKLLEDNIDLASSSIVDLAQTTVNEILEVGRAGLLVDMMQYNTMGMTVAEVQQLNIRPYIKLYTTENIINWDYDLINNQNELSLLVLSEIYNININMFEREEKIRYRVYSIEEGVCVLRIYQANEKKAFDVVSESIPMMNGKALTFIPFISIASEDLTIDPTNPPLLDISDINISYWWLSIEHRNGLHWIGVPKPYGKGIDMKRGESVTFGASSIDIFPRGDAEIKFAEFTGKGLSEMKEEKLEKKNAMLALGARLLAPESSSQISENTMQMKTAGQRATIIQIADTVSRGITKALQYMAMWLNDSDNIIFKLNTDYNLSEMSPQMMTALFTGQQLGQIRKEDVFNALKKGEIIEESLTFEEWSGDLETQSPLDSVSIPTRTANARTNTTIN